MRDSNINFILFDSCVASILDTVNPHLIPLGNIIFLNFYSNFIWFFGWNISYFKWLRDWTYMLHEIFKKTLVSIIKKLSYFN